MIYIVRHGQTDWNLKTKKQGRMDSPLTLRGIGQAAAISEILYFEIGKNLGDFKFIISPLFRARQFACIISEHLELNFDNFIIDDRLVEHSFGLWEGLTDGEIDERFSGMAKKRSEDRWEYIVPMGESYELASKRIEPLLEEIKDQNVVLVTHEMISKSIRGIYGRLSNEDTLNLCHSQDIVYKLDCGKITPLERSSF
jgi:probable phosphoglycerate mutase